MGGGETGEFDFETWLGQSRAKAPQPDAYDARSVDARLAALAADARIARLAEEARREPESGLEPIVSEPPPQAPPEPFVAAAPPRAAPTAPPASKRPSKRGRPVPGAGDAYVVTPDTPIAGDVETLWASLPSASAPRSAPPRGSEPPPSQRQRPADSPDPAPRRSRKRTTAKAPKQPRQPRQPKQPKPAKPTRQPARRAAAPTPTRQPARRAAAPTPTRPADRSEPRIDVPLVVGALIFLVGIGALAAWWAVGRSTVPTTASTVGDVSLNVTRCDADGATAIVVNGGLEAREFDATVTFTAEGRQLFPVVVPLELPPGAQQTLRIPFTGRLDSSAEFLCTGALSNVQAPS